MASEQIITLLIEERDRLQAAIDALQGGPLSTGTKTRKKPGRPPKSVSTANAPTAPVIDPLAGIAPKKKAKWSAAKRKAQGERMKMLWAKKKAGKSKGGKVAF